MTTKRRYVLRCRTCHAEFDDDGPLRTIGDVQEKHFMVKHDTADVVLELYDRWTKTAKPWDG